jgi:hypothetical protein
MALYHADAKCSFKGPGMTFIFSRDDGGSVLNGTVRALAGGQQFMPRTDPLLGADGPDPPALLGPRMAIDRTTLTDSNKVDAASCADFAHLAATRGHLLTLGELATGSIAVPQNRYFYA